MEKLKPEDEGYKVLNRYVNGQKMNHVFNISLNIHGKDKGRSPFKDSVVLSFPAEAGMQNTEQWIVHYNGQELHVHKDTIVKDGKLEVQVETLHTFAVISRENADETSWNNHVKKVKTGDENHTGFYLTIAFISILVIAAGLSCRKRRK